MEQNVVKKQWPKELNGDLVVPVKLAKEIYDAAHAFYMSQDIKVGNAAGQRLDDALWEYEKEVDFFEG